MMKRALLIVTVVLLIPVVVAAQSTVGVFFDEPGVMTYSPAAS